MKNCKEETLLFENFHAFQLNKKLVFYKYRGRLDFFIRRNNQAIQKSNKCFVIILSYSCSLSIFLINSKQYFINYCLIIHDKTSIYFLLK